MRKLFFTTAMAAALALALAPTFGQAADAPRTTSGAAATTAPDSVSPANAQKLIGRPVVNAQNETIGEVDSVMMGSNGRIAALIVSIGGFLGVGERQARLDAN